MYQVVYRIKNFVYSFVKCFKLRKVVWFKYILNILNVLYYELVDFNYRIIFENIVFKYLQYVLKNKFFKFFEREECKILGEQIYLNFLRVKYKKLILIVKFI